MLSSIETQKIFENEDQSTTIDDFEECERQQILMEESDTVQEGEKEVWQKKKKIYKKKEAIKFVKK